MKAESVNNSVKLTGYGVLLLIVFFAVHATAAQSMHEMAPKGDMKGGPPAGGPMGQGQMPMMAAAELQDKDQSDYFTDLTTETASVNAYIDYLFKRGLIGDPQGDRAFHPGEKLTRGDLAFMLNNKYRYAKTGGHYEDIALSDYYYEAVSNGKASHIFEDIPNFSPHKPVTREQMVLWIYRSEINNGMPPFMVSADVSSFNDGASFSDELQKAVGTLAKMQIIKADPKGKFDTAKELTRSEIIPVLYHLSFLGGGPGGPGGPGGDPSADGPGGPGGMMPGGAPGVVVDHGDAANTLSHDASGKIFTSTSDDENALRVGGDIHIQLDDVVIQKTAGRANSGESCNFYGSNAAFLAMDGAQVIVNNSKVESSTRGGNGIFSYGEGTEVTVNNCIIHTSEGSSGGIMVTGGGAMTVNNSHIETQGRSSAALRTDRGGGTLTVNGGSYIAHGEGSPSIYSTAKITVSNASLTATSSEAVVIEGKNSVSLQDCTVAGKMIKNNVENLQNVMIYQSMSGDAEQGRSSFSMEGGSLTSHIGDMFYVTNTSCDIRLKSVAIIPANDVFLKVVGNDARNGWGLVGKNGGNCHLSAQGQKIKGKIIVDNISSLAMSLTDSSQFTGTINAGKEGGEVFLHLDKGSKWILSGDSSVTSLTGELDNIDINGHKLYINGQLFHYSQLVLP